MKKIMSIILCVVMAFALAVNMFADESAVPPTTNWTRKTTYAVDSKPGCKHSAGFGR